MCALCRFNFSFQVFLAFKVYALLLLSFNSPYGRMKAKTGLCVSSPALF